MQTPSIRRAFLLTAVGVLTAAPALAENVHDIVQTAIERYEKRLANIESVVLVQSVMGMEVRTEMEKRIIEGHPTLVPTGDSPGMDPGAFFSQMKQMEKVAKLKGKESVNGVECWLIEVDDMSAFEMEPQPTGAPDFEANRGRFWIDRENYVMAKMTMDGEALTDGDRVPVTMEMTLRDYREREGFLWPFATDIVVQGLQAGMSEEDLEEAKKALEEMKTQLAEMPEDQRQMMESMMGGQMDKLEEMVNSGEMRMTIEVVSLTVNGD